MIYSGKNFDEQFLSENWPFWQNRIGSVTDADVRRVLTLPAGRFSFEKVIALVSPAAQEHLEQMANLSRQLTVQRFGKTIKLYAPLYLSNHCINSCLYCGFNCRTKFNRTRLTIEEALADAQIIASEGFRDILLVTSEDPEFITIDYLAELAKKLKDKFSSISVEIYPLTEEQYSKLFCAGIDGVTIYQETYNPQTYSHYHPAGPKSDYMFRLETPSRAAGAGMREIGLGALLGLENWRIETIALGLHAHNLIKRYWQSHISISFPRLRPAQGVNLFDSKCLVSDANLVQMILALRLCFADIGLVLSTREPAKLRDELIGLGITRISAGSKTNPGGYSSDSDSVGQFEVNDTRAASEVASMIVSRGFEPVWKDWDKSFSKAR